MQRRQRAIAPRRRRRQAGQGLVEYSIIVAVIGAALLAGVRIVGANTAQAFCNVSGGLNATTYGAGAAWGSNTTGMAGIGSSASPTAPTTMQTGTACIRTVSGGHWHSLAMTADGTVLAFGWNNDGQLGNGANLGTTNPSPTPAPVAGVSNAVAIAAGEETSYAVESDGSVWSWGGNTHGDLGQNLAPDTGAHQTPARVAAGACAVAGECGAGAAYLNGVVAVAAGDEWAMALRSDGTVWSWGYDGYGMLGNGGALTDSQTPVQVAVSGITSISSGYIHGVALAADGTVWSWGSNSFGELGGNTSCVAPAPNGPHWWCGQSTPVHMLAGACTACAGGLMTGATSIGASGFASYVVRGDGTLWSLGSNQTGELGIGGAADLNVHGTPAQVVAGACTGCGAFLSKVTGVGGGAGTGLALLSDGSVYVWGDNAFGEYGNGTSCGSWPCSGGTTPSLVPGITGDRKAISLGNGETYTMMIVTLRPVS